MARKNKKRDASSQPAGFVPASAHGGHGGRNSIEFDSATPTIGAPADAPVANGSVAQYSRNSANYTHRRSRGMSRGKKVVIAIVIIALIAAVSGLGFFIYKEMQKQAINNDLHDDMTQEEMEALDNELTGMVSFDQPFTTLLLGSDARSDDPDMGARTDTIVLVRVDPTINTISMVSIPRDTKVNIPGVGTQKINAAFSYGGAAGTIAAVKDLCGVDIDHYAQIDFEGLVGLVDAIGGIDVYNDERIEDINAGDVGIEQGLVHLDGQGALVFSRTRAYADGDFTRVSNQRKVIEAIVKKGLEAPATELYGLVKASTSFLTTDSAMDVDFIYSLADQIRHNNDYPVTLYTATIPASTDMIGGVSYVIADQAGVNEMMRIFESGGDVSGGEAHVIEEASSSAASTTESTN